MFKHTKAHALLFIASLFITSSCSSDTDENSALQESLANAEYPIELTASGKANLTDGYLEEQAAPGSATKIKISLLSLHAWGDLNNDGNKDAAVILVGDSGGSGTSYYVSAVLNKKEGIMPIDSKFLGDRIEVNSITITDGSIEVEFLRRSAEEPMSSTPSIKTISKFEVKDNSLYKIDK